MRLDDCYRTLEIEPGASLDDARRAHRDLTKVWHPDRFGHDEALQRKAGEKLKSINEAWETIRGTAGRADAGGRQTDEPAIRVRSRGREYRFARLDDVVRLANRGSLGGEAELFDPGSGRWMALASIPAFRKALAIARMRRLRTWALMSGGLALLLLLRRPTLGSLVIALVLAFVALAILTRQEPAD